MTFAIRLEFDGDPGDGDEPIRGRLVGSDGRSQAFDGWLRLLGGARERGPLPVGRPCGRPGARPGTYGLGGS